MRKRRLRRLKKTQITQIILLSIFLATLYSLLATYNAEAASFVPMQELLENAEAYDGKRIAVKGEAIGDIMIRRNYAWINVRDETGALGIFCPKDLVDSLQSAQGSYGYKGDIVSVRGLFHRFCSQHGGESDIHAQKISVIQKGKVLAHLIEPQKVKGSMILPAIAFILAIIHLITRRLR